MERSQNSELAKRVNQAFVFLKRGIPHSQIADRLVNMFGTSKVQAYRYILQAKENKKRVPIPENSVVFTVKLAPSLIKKIKSFAHSQGMSISKVVRAALEEFLAKKGHGQNREGS